MRDPYKLLSQTTQYFYDGANVWKEYGAHGEPLAEYAIANRQVLSRQMFGLHDRRPYLYEGHLSTTGGMLYYESDGLGSVTALTNRLGAQVMGYRYDAFGNLFTQMAAPYNTLGYTGQMYDARSGLVNMGARWYSPSVGRFTTPDTYAGTWTQPLTQNPYLYVGDNPVNFTDPTGHTAYAGTITLSASATSATVGDSVFLTANTTYPVGSDKALYIHWSGGQTKGGLESSSFTTSVSSNMAQTVAYWADLQLPNGTYAPSSNTVSVTWHVSRAVVMRTSSPPPAPAMSASVGTWIRQQWGVSHARWTNAVQMMVSATRAWLATVQHVLPYIRDFEQANLDALAQNGTLGLSGT